MNEGDITVGLRAPYDAPGGGAGLGRFAARVETTGIDRLCVGDHVTFKGGRGFDGLLNATALAMASDRLTVQTAVYLLPLRHPVPVARQVASLAALAPGRLSFGVGLGGEDPAELRACGVDPATRGRRMDEALTVLRPLLEGAEVTMSGAFFSLDRVRIRPAPAPPVPIVIGGRSEAALRRVARHGDGWLGLWVSPGRYANAVERISQYASDEGRPVTRWQHGMHVWCGFDASAGVARSRLAVVMEEFYQTPFIKFERYCPCGTPEDVAASLQPYVDAGCRSFNLIPLADSAEAAIDGAAAVRAALRGVAPRREST
ncbi:MAG TPA: LLM class flavin-dependent oxidoreductase [Streptosporangiaceae bacterium]|jgi:alkanesulfonate monooxygenase SsuD/methylene tetrahydromethanopterin reductase-like flavin-dependent oxidoreductase (luciferase family)|nr:LLM class flavin-dependent oxidoreductase [Streptosporangiaceae bacterium]